ncbi:MAG TPA: hypothetical protein VNN80_33835, partial [Polyangiaceae bacterium]|nr:hypothetical protein [Polyangiaceae bacterium]
MLAGALGGGLGAHEHGGVGAGQVDATHDLGRRLLLPPISQPLVEPLRRVQEQRVGAHVDAGDL